MRLSGIRVAFALLLFMTAGAACAAISTECPDGPQFREAWDKNSTVFIGGLVPQPAPASDSPVQGYEYGGSFSVGKSYKGAQEGSTLQIWRDQRVRVVPLDDEAIYMIFTTRTPQGVYLSSINPCYLGK